MKGRPRKYCVVKECHYEFDPPRPAGSEPKCDNCLNGVALGPERTRALPTQKGSRSSVKALTRDVSIKKVSRDVKPTNNPSKNLWCRWLLRPLEGNAMCGNATKDGNKYCQEDIDNLPIWPVNEDGTLYQFDDS